MKKRFLSTGEAARICSVTRDTVLKWIHSGRISAIRTMGGHHRIDFRDLERFMTELPSLQRNEAKAEPANLGPELDPERDK